MQKINEYKTIKVICEDKNKNISIITSGGKEKILKRSLNNDKIITNMLKNEANILYQLRNSSVVPKLIDYNFDKDNNYIIIELINGTLLKNIHFNNTKEKILLMIKIINAVSKIHKYGIIHCDLKPSNIILDINGNIRIIDYGISIYKVNYFSEYGTIKYCSREQASKSTVTFNTDLYSLGIIFYELINGKVPFHGTKDEIKNKKILCDYDKSDNESLNTIFSKIFNINIEYKSIDDFKSDLIKYLQQLDS